MARTSKRDCSIAGKRLATKTTGQYLKKDAAKDLANCKTKAKKTTAKKTTAKKKK